jgi:membrane fusion protein
MFRNAAIEARRSRYLGDVIIAPPPSLKVIITFSVVIAVAMMAVFVKGTYTQHVAVVGRLMPQGGIAKIFPSFPGTIKAKHVADGQAVKAGDTLYVLSGERRDGRGTAALATVTEHIAARQHLLSQELSTQEESQRIELKQWQQRVQNQSREIAKYDELIAAQLRLVALARDSANRYRRLHPLGAVSKEQADKAQADFHEKQSALYTLERDRLVAARAFADANETLASMPHNHRQQRSRLQRELAKLSQELAENEAAREFAVVAPIDGKATAVVAHVGQHVIETKPLLSIVPEDEPLEAHLYVQSYAVGYLRPDSQVRLRYQAFPYQTHGMHHGRILSISEASAPHEEISDIEPYHQRAGGPLYLVRVSLERQSVDAPRGESHRLRAGMMLEANVARETRRLYEWAFEPLHRLRDKL